MLSEAVGGSLDKFARHKINDSLLYRIDTDLFERRPKYQNRSQHFTEFLAILNPISVHPIINSSVFFEM